MTELLAPAGNYEAFIAAVSNGADAVYLAAKSFGARAYADNFSLEELKDVVEYAHLRNVKIYVTMNTIVFDDELADAKAQIDDLAKINIDGIIVADLALIEYIASTYKNLEAHTSTQVGIDDIYGVNYCSTLGMKRSVIGREVSITDIKEIKKQSSMPLEVFVHGALCVSYSGNCLMSGLIGFRSGNRGRCVGSCRKPYELYDKTTGTSYGLGYYLSMKDLNTTTHINELKGVADSIKIEGRMKEPVYVANIVKNYRDLLDNKKADVSMANYKLEKTFNRTFTKGYLFGEDKKDITNIVRPNHSGQLIGEIVKKNGELIKIKLIDKLNQNDNIRITGNEEANLAVVKMFDKDDNLINSSSTFVYLKLEEDLHVGDKVYRTKDLKFEQELAKSYPNEFRRFPVTMYLNGKAGENLSLTVEYKDTSVTVTGDYTLEVSNNKTLDNAKLTKQLDRLKDTPYKLDSLVVNCESNLFIPSSILNNLRREAIELLNKERLTFTVETLEKKELSHKAFNIDEPNISVFVRTKEQEQAARELGVDIIYSDENFVARNHSNYIDGQKTILAGGLGALDYYKDTKVELVTDYSLNVVNAEALDILFRTGASRVTLSHEMNKSRINSISEDYKALTGGYPNLEMIVYGYVELMQTKYNPLKAKGIDNLDNDTFVLRDKFSEFKILPLPDGDTTLILNGKRLNLIDNIDEIQNINVLRLQFSTESYEETKTVIRDFQTKLFTKDVTELFDQNTDTRGHFYKEIL